MSDIKRFFLLCLQTGVHDDLGAGAEIKLTQSYYYCLVKDLSPVVHIQHSRRWRSKNVV